MAIVPRVPPWTAQRPKKTVGNSSFLVGERRGGTARTVRGPSREEERDEEAGRTSDERCDGGGTCAANGDVGSGPDGIGFRCEDGGERKRGPSGVEGVGTGACGTGTKRLNFSRNGDDESNEKGRS